MKKNLPLYILLLFLIVVNAFFLYNYLGNGEKEEQNKEHKPQGNFLVKELGFDDEQKEQFKALNREHRRDVRGITDEIREMKDALFGGLSDASLGDVNTDSIATLIGEKEKQKELLTLNHFSSVQELCNDKQKGKFSKIINDALRKGERDQGPPRGGRPDGDRPNRPNEPRGDEPRGDRPPPPER